MQPNHSNPNLLFPAFCKLFFCEYFCFLNIFSFLNIFAFSPFSLLDVPCENQLFSQCQGWLTSLNKASAVHVVFIIRLVVMY